MEAAASTALLMYLHLCRKMTATGTLRRFILSWSFALCIVLARNVVAGIWYVDNAASGAGTGVNWANAWTNLAKVKGVLPGDTVYISGGSASKTYSVFNGTYYQWIPLDSGNGADGAPITYKVGQDVGHNGTVIFDGKGTNYWYGGGWRNGVVSGEYQGKSHMIVTNLGQTAIIADNAQNVRFEYINIYGAVRFNGATNIELSHLNIIAPNGSDYVINWNVFPFPANSISFTNNQIHDCVISGPMDASRPGFGADGIQSGRNTSVYGNLFSPYYVPSYNGGQHLDGWQNLGGSNCRVFGNIFENIPNYAIYWECFGSVSNVFVYNNLFRHNVTFAQASGPNIGVAFGPQQVNGCTFSNIVVANNTFSDFFGRVAIGMGQLKTTNTWQQSYLVNNLFVNSTPVQFFNSASGFQDTYTNGLTIACNLAYAGARGNSTFTPGQSLAPSVGSVLPFVNYSELSSSNDLRIRASQSVDVFVGMNLASIFQQDADGKQRPAVGNWSVGAYEVSGGTLSSSRPSSPTGLRLQ